MSAADFAPAVEAARVELLDVLEAATLLEDEDEDPTRVNAVAILIVLGNEESVTAGTLVTGELDDVEIGVLVVKGV